VTSRLDRHTGAFCVWSVSDCADRRAYQSTAAATQARPSRPIAHTQRRCTPCKNVNTLWMDFDAGLGRVTVRYRSQLGSARDARTSLAVAAPPRRAGPFAVIVFVVRSCVIQV